MFFHLLHWFEQCLSIILERHDQLQLGASWFHCCGKKQNRFKMLHMGLLTFSFLETKPHIFALDYMQHCNIWAPRRLILTGQEFSKTIQSVQSTWDGFELMTRTKNGCMNTTSTLTEHHVQEQLIGALFSLSSTTFGLPANKGHTLGKEIGCLQRQLWLGLQWDAQQTSP